MNMAFMGGDNARRREATLIRKIEMLTPEETEKKKHQEFLDNWKWLAVKKRG